jgi:tetratricopeptide (TPR) repeat protein
MRRSRLRFTVKRLMVAIAALALVLGCSIEAVRLKRWRDAALERAEMHAQLEHVNRDLERSALEMVKMHEGIADRDPALSRRRGQLVRKWAEYVRQQKAKAAEEREEAAKYAEAAAYHAALREKYRRAAAQPWRAVEADPPPPDPHGQGRHWADRGRYSRALASYEEALRLDPENYDALNDLAWLLATCPDAGIRDGKRAVELASRACRLNSGNSAACVDTLAAAHAEAGDFEAAAESERKAIAMLPQGDAESESYRLRLEKYKGKKPYREGSMRGE